MSTVPLSTSPAEVTRQTPTISVLLLSYNHVEFVERSVRSALEQQPPMAHVVVDVIDDGSTDGTVGVLRSLESEHPERIRVTYKAHGGPATIAQNFNELIRAAQGEFVAFLASDDEYLPDRFSSQLRILLDQDDVAIVYGDGLNRRPGRRPGGSVMTRDSRAALQSEDVPTALRYVLTTIPAIFIQSVLARRGFLAGFAPFDDDLIADDWVFNIHTFTQLRRLGGQFRYVDQSVFIRNLHSRNTTHDLEVHDTRVSQVIERYFAPRDQRRWLLLRAGRAAVRERRWRDAFINLMGYVSADPTLRALRLGVARRLEAHRG